MFTVMAKSHLIIMFYYIIVIIIIVFCMKLVEDV